ncbi:MAG: hypothetical protein N3E39_04050 [Candidatus Methanomethylicia archaeon]|nr:hypothetical protein [Candidatus Methanomethylicia archaeon]
MSIKVKREVIERIISTCERVLRRGLDPFIVDVEKYISYLKNFLIQSQSTEDLVLDLKALEALSRIVEFQGRWIMDKSSKLFFDPLIIELKIKSLSLDDLAHVFCSAFYPIASLKLISHRGFEEAVKYWFNLPSLRDRWGRFPKPVFSVEYAPIEDLIREKLVLKGSFTEMLEEFWNRIKVLVKNGVIYYWDLIKSDNFEDSILKAYMITFLVSYGYVGLDFDLKSEDYIIIPFENRIEFSNSNSIAISISYDEWLRRVKNGG